MIIIPDISGEVEVKIPNNLQKVDEEVQLYLKHTETKKEFYIDLVDRSSSKYLYIADIEFNHNTYPYGEYEYEIGGNKGLLRLEREFTTKEYNDVVEFKSYEDK